MKDDLGYTIAERPHPDAVFARAWRSRHSPKPMDGWRFVYGCAQGCQDAIGDMSAERNPDDHPKVCPDCRGPVERLRPSSDGIPRQWKEE
jgi:hypothetical protein